MSSMLWLDLWLSPNISGIRGGEMQVVVGLPGTRHPIHGTIVLPSHGQEATRKLGRYKSG